MVQLVALQRWLKGNGLVISQFYLGMPRNPTILQQRAAEIYVEKRRNGEKITGGQIVKEAGYSAAVSIKPQQDVFGTAGYKQALRNLGLTEELITCSLKEDIEAKPKARLGELRLGAELLQMTEPAGDKGNVKVEISFIKREG